MYRVIEAKTGKDVTKNEDWYLDSDGCLFYATGDETYPLHPAGREDYQTGPACQERDMAYRAKSVKQLFDQYAFEEGRVNWEDREITQGKIRNELRARLEAAISLLGSDDPGAVYRTFLG